MKTKKDIYHKLSYEEKQICDLCEDWYLGNCEVCEFTTRYQSKEITQEENWYEYCIIHNWLP